MVALTGIIEAIALACSCSADAFTACFAYGSNKIRIPMSSIQIINLVCSSILGLSLLAGGLVWPFLPTGLTKAVCFGILFILGIIKLLDGATKALIRKYNRIDRQLKFSLFNFRFILNLYSNPLDADADASKTITAGEAAALALSLSLDGLAVGFGAALGHVNIAAVVVASLVTNTLSVTLGCRAGYRLSDRIPVDLSWLGGAILMALAVIKLF